MLEDFLPQHTVSQELFKTEIQNLELYGYGTKSFMLSMIEAALDISGKAIGVEIIEKIIALGKAQLDAPVEVLPDITEVLTQLQGKYRLIVATKGDLKEQERKLKKSGLAHFFHHVEIVSEKTEAEYERIIQHLDIGAAEFLMIGNSLKSDVVPVLNIGGYGFHVPYHTTWEHEKIDIKIDNPRFKHLEKITEVLEYIN
jgi:putative hydrolase of the HAD superfamily